MIRVGHPAVRAATSLSGIALAVTWGIAGCSHLPSMNPSSLWPWHRKAPPPPQEVHEIEITSEGGTSGAFPQYWKRNTLLVDLQGASGTGAIVLKPRDGGSWPVRLALRVTPGSVGAVEVRADQRTVLPVTAEGTKPIDLELVPGIYTPKTAQIGISWGPAPQPTP
jgi:hypothetical protein